MKKILSIIILSIILIPSLAFASPFDLEITHRDSGDTTDVAQNLTPPTLMNNTNYLPYFNDIAEEYRFVGIGSGINLASGFLSVTPSSIETPQGHLTDTLAGFVSTTTFSGLSGTVASLSGNVSILSSSIASIVAPLPVSSFMVNEATSTLYIASSTAVGFMSAAMVTKLNSLSTSTPHEEHAIGSSSSGGTYTFTFATAFGSSPNVQVQVEDATANALTNVQIISRSTSSVTVKVTRSIVSLGLLTSVTNPTGVTVDIVAKDN